ncbi:uncharacterized protein LOC123036885 [Varanus komodoensis]|uniref:uncharacterized protein LOC123036885 n=1 Tax=Varanus komodoensis TaxID=61221 RepID=UPI001CF79D34|nr:uncharacterized protein LOC123036885 [Varanus komodoensis]
MQTMLQLLFLGALLVAPAHFQQPPCDLVRNTVARGSFKLDVEPATYKPGNIYVVSITGVENGTSVILQAAPTENSSGGLWESKNKLLTCGNSENVVQRNISGSGTRTRWTSPSDAHVASALIRAFVSFSNGTTLLQTRSLLKDLQTAAVASTPATATDLPPARQPTRHNSAPNSHDLLNATAAHHNFASAHQGTKGPHSSVSVAQSSNVLLAALQLLSISLGYKLLC